jgi:hypothetical protein
LPTTSISISQCRCWMHMLACVDTGTVGLAPVHKSLYQKGCQKYRLQSLDDIAG